ncbi:MAG: pilus assembly protein PilM [Candidatus Andersenbacteria bacterium]
MPRAHKATRHASRRLLGLDFGAHSLKLAEVEHGPLGPVIKTFGVAPYETDGSGRADLVKTLEDLLRSARVTTREAILTVPETDACIIDTGHTPDQLRSKLDPRLAAVAVCWPVGERLLTLPRWIYDFYESIITTAGLSLGGVQHVSSVLGRSVTDRGRAAVLDLGAESTGWYVYDHGQLVQRATLPYGGEALTNALALAHGWTREHAEQHKRKLSGDPHLWPDETRLVLQTFLERWWSDLHQYLAEQPAHLTQVTLVGGGARSAPLREFVFGQLGLLPQEWQLPVSAHVAEPLRPYLDPSLHLLANSLSHLVY